MAGKNAACRITTNNLVIVESEADPEGDRLSAGDDRAEVRRLPESCTQTVVKPTGLVNRAMRSPDAKLRFETIINAQSLRPANSEPQTMSFIENSAHH